MKDEAGHKQRHITNSNNYWYLNVSFSFSFHLCKAITDDSCVPSCWILQHFPHISGWASLPDYIEDMSRATTFIPLSGNQSIESYKVNLDHLVAKDMHFNNYVDHRDTRPFDEIMLYSRWLACKSRLISPHCLSASCDI